MIATCWRSRRVRARARACANAGVGSFEQSAKAAWISTRSAWAAAALRTRSAASGSPPIKRASAAATDAPRGSAAASDPPESWWFSSEGSGDIHDVRFHRRPWIGTLQRHKRPSTNTLNVRGRQPRRRARHAQRRPHQVRLRTHSPPGPRIATPTRHQGVHARRMRSSTTQPHR